MSAAHQKKEHTWLGKMERVVARLQIISEPIGILCQSNGIALEVGAELRFILEMQIALANLVPTLRSFYLYIWGSLRFVLDVSCDFSLPLTVSWH